VRRLPKSIKVLTQKVSFAKADGIMHEGNVACDGMYFPAARRIELDSALRGDAEREVALHETLHATITVAGIDRFMPDLDEEMLVQGLAPALLSLIRENKAFVAYLQEAE
jgi:hypothetical protein